MAFFCHEKMVDHQIQGVRKNIFVGPAYFEFKIEIIQALFTGRIAK